MFPEAYLLLTKLLCILFYVLSAKELLRQEIEEYSTNIIFTVALRFYLTIRLPACDPSQTFKQNSLSVPEFESVTGSEWANVDNQS